MFIPFSKPEIGDDEISEVQDTLRSGWLTTGKKAIQFEEAFAEYLGDELACLAVNSATSGLHLALEAIGVAPGDEVITTTHTFTATAEVIRYMGAHPIFVDIDLDTYGIDIKQIEQKITPNTKAIIPVHYAGLALDIDAILSICTPYGIKVIEDAAHALPSCKNGVLVGSNRSAATVFSFYANKTMTTGEGGMVVTRDADLAERIKVMRLHGIDRSAFDRYQSTVPKWYYEVIAPGYKYNLTDIAASLGLHQLKKINKMQRGREIIADAYLNELGGLPIAMPPLPKVNDTHSWHLFSINLENNPTVSRDDFIARMSEKGVGCSVHYIPLHRQPYWKNTYHLKKEDFPNSEKLYSGQVSLPIYPSLDEMQLAHIINSVKEIIQ